MKNLSDRVTRKFTDSIPVNNLEIMTDSGWSPLTIIHKTIPYDKWSIVTESGLNLDCADTHIVFNEHMEEIFVRDIIPGNSKIQTINGIDVVKTVNHFDTKEEMFDVSVDSKDRRYYTNGILSHNTTVIDAILYTFYAKTTKGLTQSQIINSVNLKETVTEVEFNLGKDHYLVRRGIKPNFFEIIKNGILLKEIGSSTREEQKYLEDQILRMNYKTFTQIVLLSSANFVPFFSLPAPDRRAIVEDILDISIFASMKKVHKKRHDAALAYKKAIENDIQSKEEQIRVLSKTYDKMIEETNSIISEKESQIESERKKLTIAIREVDDRFATLNAFSETLEKDSTRVKTELEKERRAIHEIQVQIKEIIRSSKFFGEHSVCPSCHQSIDEEKKSFELKEMRKKAQDLNKRLSTHEENKNELESIQKNDIDERERQYQTMFGELQTKQFTVSSIESSISHLEHDLRRLKSKNDDAVIGDPHFLATEIESLKKDLTHLNENDMVNAKFEIRHLEIVQDMLKDTGIRSDVVKSYLPIINKTMSKYLDMFDFFVLFQIDENFNETIKQRHYTDFSYSSFSEGLKSRLNLAMLFTFREIIKLKNSAQVNLLFLDEIFQSSLDAEGKEVLLNVLRDGFADENVFIISHDQSIKDEGGFTRHLTFSMKNGFTSYEEEEIQGM